MIAIMLRHTLARATREANLFVVHSTRELRACLQALDRFLLQRPRMTFRIARTKADDAITDWQLQIIALRLVVTEMGEELQGCPVQVVEECRP